MWLVFAVLSAVFAALTSILAKVGIDNVNSNLATAIRTLVVLVMAWVMVLPPAPRRGWDRSPSAAWFFWCFRGWRRAHPGCAITAPSSSAACPKVVPIDKMSVVITLILAFVFLHEEFSLKMLIGSVLITAGTLVMVL